MTPERWQQVDEVFQAVIELKPKERHGFIESACSGDVELRREVESLITADDLGLSFIDEPAVQVAASLLATGEPEMAEGQSIGHYEIVGLIGRGGMGEVYLAKDNRLNRQIALKLLPADYTKHKDRMRRFQREAHAVSALNHPNILTIHELGEVDGQQFIATELVEGETLRGRLKRGPLALSETLEIAVQTASALAAAHHAGIVHRDIKPENIMLRPDGYVKVLDFGLAKLTQQEERPRKLIETEKTEMSSGLVMGTFKYMSPEQARGQSVDTRSDIFSFGVVLYELLAGRAPFEGETTSELIAAILKKDPPLLADVPAELQQLINKALRKKKEDRYRSIRELLIDLKSLQQDEAASGGGVQMASATPPGAGLSTSETGAVSTQSTIESIVSGIKRHKTGTAFILASLVIVGVGLTGGIGRLTTRLREPSTQMKITRIPGTDKALAAAVSPDGKYIALASFDGGSYQIELLDIGTNDRKPLVRLPKNAALTRLRFSRTGEKLFYVSDTSLYQMILGSNALSRVMEDTGCIDLDVSPDERHVACLRSVDPQNTLSIMTTEGTDERILVERSNPEFLVSPVWSPDGKEIAFASGSAGAQRTAHISVIDAAGGGENQLTDDRWLTVDQIIWQSDGSGLIAAAQDLAGVIPQIWEISNSHGEPRRITNDLEGYGSISLTADGKNLAAIDSSTRSSIWLVPGGDTTVGRPITSGEHHRYRHVAWTPDGRILYKSSILGGRDIWIMNADGSDARQLTGNAGENQQPQPCGNDSSFVFSSNRLKDDDREYDVWRMNIDGFDAVQITHGENAVQPVCTPDGRTVVYSKGGPYSKPEQKTLWKISMDGGQPVQISDRPSMGPDVSPDGKLIACWYRPDDARSSPMKLTLFSIDGGPPVRIFDVTRTTIHPVRWSPDGRMLYYNKKQDAIGNIWSQPVNGGTPKPVTKFTSEEIQGFDWSRDERLVCSRTRGVQDVVLISGF